MVVILAKWTFL